MDVKFCSIYTENQCNLISKIEDVKITSAFCMNKTRIY